MTNVSATQEELSALVQELICGDDEHAELAALKISLYGCESLAYLAPVLADPDPDRRWWAARASIVSPGSLNRTWRRAGLRIWRRRLSCWTMRPSVQRGVPSEGKWINKRR
jgi:hypothetical protein